jgi:hypothetical protein
MAVSGFEHSSRGGKAAIAAIGLLTLVGTAQAAPPSQSAIDNLSQRMFGVIGHIEWSPSTAEWFTKWFMHAIENPTNQMDFCGVEFVQSKTFDGPQCRKYFAHSADTPTCLNCSSNGQ